MTSGRMKPVKWMVGLQSERTRNRSCVQIVVLEHHMDEFLGVPLQCLMRDTDF